MGYVVFLIALLTTAAVYACTVFSGNCAREEEHNEVY
jgi:hypothetical protein